MLVPIRHTGFEWICHLFFQSQCFQFKASGVPLDSRRERRNSRTLIVGRTQGHPWLRCCRLLAAAAAAGSVCSAGHSATPHTHSPPNSIPSPTRLAAPQLHHHPITSPASGAWEGEACRHVAQPAVAGAPRRPDRSLALREHEPLNWLHHRVFVIVSLLLPPSSPAVIQPNCSVRSDRGCGSGFP